MRLTTRNIDDGFSLIEIMVVLAVVALAISVTVPNVQFRQRSQTAVQVQDSLAVLFRHARMQALTSGMERDVVIDLDARTATLAGAESITIPAAISATLRVGAELIDGRNGTVAFFPDGASTGLEIALKDTRGAETLLRVSWLTGLVSTEQAQ